MKNVLNVLQNGNFHYKGLTQASLFSFNNISLSFITAEDSSNSSDV